MAQYRHLSTPDPELANVSLPPSLPFVPPISVFRFIERLAAGRETVKKAYEGRLPAPEEISVEDRKVPVEGGEISVRCYKLAKAAEGETYPLLVWFHGGGFAMGNYKTDEPRLKILCKEAQISVISVDYRLAPEHPYPIPWDDGYAATKWAAQNASVLSASLDKGFVVAGTSAGGNLATTVAHRALDDAFFAQMPITGQLLQIPPTLHPELELDEYKDELLSRHELKIAPIVPLNSQIKFAKWSRAPKTAEGWSVILRDHKGVPPAFFQIGGMDPLRDEALLYAKLLEQAGTKTKVEVYPGLPHSFNTLYPQLSASRKFDADAVAGVKWLLSGAPSDPSS